MLLSSHEWPRRRLLRVLVGGAGLAAVGGCRVFPPEEGPAYSPWREFPDAELPPDLRAIGAAILAASPHNTQPWWFDLSNARIDVHVDDTRNIGAMDSRGRERRIGVGCAIENLTIAASSFGLLGAPILLPQAGDAGLVARLDYSLAEPRQHALFDAIARRHTARGDYLDVQLGAEVAPTLTVLIADLAPVELVILTTAGDRDGFRGGTIAATQAILDDAEMLQDSDAWYRHTAGDIETHRDGVTLDASGLGAGMRVLGKAGKRPSAATSGKYWLRATRGRQTTGSAFALLVTPELDDTRALLTVGRAWQRIHLWLVANGLAAQPLNQMAERRDREVTGGLAPEFGDRLAALVGDGRAAQMLFRIGLAWDPPFESPRRPVEWVLERS